MHKYMRAIGFSKLKTRNELQNLLTNSVKTANTKCYTTIEGEVLLSEFCKDFAEDFGLCVRGEYDEEGVFHYDYYFPYLRAYEISSNEDITVERHAEKESYAGVCDDIKIGVSLIFYLQNIVTYLKLKNEKRLPISPTSLSLSALSVQGSIMMPIEKQRGDEEKLKKVMQNRNRLLAEARRGDEEAIETLTLEDMDTYTTISKKILHEDVFSLVDSYFMPYGVECDYYSILGEILSCKTERNTLTGEECYIMGLCCNDLHFDVCINSIDLYGEPQIGRRFKGTIWMQGMINYPD